MKRREFVTALSAAVTWPFGGACSEDRKTHNRLPQWVDLQPLMPRTSKPSFADLRKQGLKSAKTSR